MSGEKYIGLDVQSTTQIARPPIQLLNCAGDSGARLGAHARTGGVSRCS
jgi:hypothetical protein